jgi:hypothetical protein
VPRTRTRRALLGLTAVLALTVPLGDVLGQVGPRSCPGESRRTRPDGWVELSRPTHEFGEQIVKDWAASAFVDGFLLSTNGDGIARSLDGGCTWEETYTSGTGDGEVGLLVYSDSIEGLALPPSPPGRLGYPVYAVTSDADGSRVVRSDNLGESWRAAPSIGLPYLAELHSIRVAADPRQIWVLADWRSTLTSLVETAFYVSVDSGETFRPVSRALSPGQFTDFRLDPVDPRVVWAWNEDALYRSADTGVTFSVVDEVEAPVSTVDVQHFPAYEPARVQAFSGSAATAARSTDGGKTWSTVKAPGRVTGTANLYTRDAIAMASSSGVHLEAPGLIRGRVDVSPRGLRMTEVEFALGGQVLTLYGRAGDVLARRRFTPQLQVVRPPAPVKLPPIDLTGSNIQDTGPTTLSPASASVSLLPGQRRRLDFTLDLAPTPTPLDVFFATDSTGSMSPVIASLREHLQDIINELGASGIDVWFGVGDFKDYPVPGFGGPTDYPYRRLREVGPIDEDLETAIEQLRPGGGMGLDSALAATYQAATGLGQEIATGSGTGGGYWIQPNQGAEFRKDALKVLFIAADVPTRDPESNPGYPGPSYRTVIQALNRRGIEHVGLAVDSGSGSDDQRETLGRVSAGTATLAPPGGVDCDEDGEADLEEGAPLVCDLVTERGATSIAPAMVGLLRSLQDLQQVSVSVSGDDRVAAVTRNAVVPDVNVKARNRVPFSVELSCTDQTAGESYPLAVQIRAGTRTVASAPVRLTCVLPETPRIEVPPAVIAAAAPLLPPPPPPPAPVPQVNPNPQPNPNPQIQQAPQAQANAGMAFEEQEQVQVAYADVGVEWEDELAIVGQPAVEERRAPEVLWVALGLTTAAGAGLAVRSRTRTGQAPALATARRR